MKRVGVAAGGIVLAVGIAGWTAWHASRPAFSYTPVLANFVIGATPVVLTDRCDVHAPDELDVVIESAHARRLRAWMAAHDFGVRDESLNFRGRMFWEVVVPDGAVPDARRAVGALPGVIEAQPSEVSAPPELVINCLDSRPLHRDLPLR